MIVSGDYVAHFVASGCGFSPCPPYTTMAIEREGELVAGLIFSCFEGADVQITAYGKGWTRGFMEEVGRYVYDTLGCCRMSFITEQPEVLAYALRLGGQIEGKMRSHFGPGRDGWIVGVLREEWPYARLLVNSRG